MAAAGKFRMQKSFDQFHGAGLVHISGAQCQHVGVVVFARQARFLGRTHRNGADSRHLVGGNGHSDAAGANRNAAAGPALRHLASHRLGEIGIVARLRGIGPEAAHLMTGAGEPLPQSLFEGKPGVIRGDRDFHKRGETRF